MEVLNDAFVLWSGLLVIIPSSPRLLGFSHWAYLFLVIFRQNGCLQEVPGLYLRCCSRSALLCLGAFTLSKWASSFVAPRRSIRAGDREFLSAPVVPKRERNGFFQRVQGKEYVCCKGNEVKQHFVLRTLF